MSGRLSQDITLAIQAGTPNARNSQEISLAIFSPTTANVRVSQDLTLVLTSNVKTIATQPEVGLII